MFQPGSPTDGCGIRTRILQLHPSRLCNLTCLHCYSRSGPHERQALALGVLQRVVDFAARERYTVVGISGGEPLLYEDLVPLLVHSRDRGLVTTVTSNGVLLRPEALAPLQGIVDLLAISIDGKPPSHDRMRNSKGAFDRMRRNLPAVRASGIPFGFIFTLTQFNLHELRWVARFARDEGAALLQIHPLEICGRASDVIADERPDHRESAFAFLEYVRLQAEIGDTPSLQLDLASRQVLAENARTVFAGDKPADDAPLSDVVSPLVVESDGWVVPIRHGFDRRFALGDCQSADLAELARSWRADVLDDFRALCVKVHRSMARTRAPTFGNWYEKMADASGAFRFGAP